MIYRYESVDSTNTVAKTMAHDGVAHGTVVLAEHQTAGRGRLGRSFESPAGAGIYMSMILRPNCRPDRLMHLTCAVAVAICDGVESALGFRPEIKWINDLVAEGKKLAGILTELSVNPQTGLVDYAIVGVGLNCNQCPEDFPQNLRDIACSAAMITGQPVDRQRLTESMIAALLEMDLSRKGEIMERYRLDCLTIGKEVVVVQGQARRQGRAVDMDEDGGLIVEFPDGIRQTVNCGEVSVRGLWGYI